MSHSHNIPDRPEKGQSVTNTDGTTPSRGDSSMNDEYPNIRRAGAYVFFGICAFGNSVIAYLPLKLLGSPHWVITNGSCIVMIASFLALRDMTARSTASGNGSGEKRAA